MNGQSYNYSDSGNGTPTPSSTSYPASLSSQSSRDCSPSRLPPNLNHINSEKSINSSNSYLNYKSHESYSNSINVFGQAYSDPVNTNRASVPPYSNDPNDINQTQRFNSSQFRQTSTASPQIISNLNSPSTKPVYSSGHQMNQMSNDQKQFGGLYTTSKMDGNISQQKGPENNMKNVETIHTSHISTGEYITNYTQSANNAYRQENILPNQMLKSDPYQVAGHQGYPVQKPVLPSQTNPYVNSPPENHVYSAPGVDNSPRSPYQQNYSPYSPPANAGYGVKPQVLPPPQARAQDEPISSGPPRTNVLGIIPYSTEPVTSQVTRPKTGDGGYYQQQQQLYQQVGAQQQQPSQVQQPQVQQQVQQGRGGQRPPAPARPKGYPPPPYQQYPSPYPQAQNNAANLPPYSQVGGGYYPSADDLANQMSHLSVAQYGYNKLWGRDAIDLLKSRDILPQTRVEPPPIRLPQEFYESSKCSPDIFRCTLTKIPETKSLLDKSRLPLGVLIHPFKDLNQLSVIQCTVIVRCRACRTYINPFVIFVDSKHWKCNLCFRVNDLPEEFQYDPLTKTYGDPSRRPEIKSATIEFIAPSEYMVRPPQPAAYVFVLDVSRLAVESGYLRVFCDCLLSQLEALPGDSRTSVAFITYDSTVHYYSLADTQAQPHQMVVVDIDDMFVPCPDNLLVNLNECLGLVRDLLRELPNKYRESFDTGTALGPALQAAYKLLAATGGRVTLLTTSLPNSGPGKLPAREDPSMRNGDGINQSHLNPVTDFYKKLALDCSGQQIAVDLFVLNSQFVDLASLSGVSRFSGGCIHHFPLFSTKNPRHIDSFQRCLQRYLCRKIGFESVMRLRCTRGLSIHTFHGNFFVRSTDLLSLPNVNPDAGFGMQVSIDENLTDIQNVCFQAALLYTSSKGERRIRVHTICLPIASNLSDVLHGADQQCIIGLLAKMAVDRCHQSSLSDAREAFVNVVADMLSAYKVTQSGVTSASLMAPSSLSLLPLYILALLKYTAFRVGQSTRLDDRVFAMCQMKSLPLAQLIQAIYPDLYPVHNLPEQPLVNVGDESIVQPPLLHLSAERIDSQGVYLMDDGEHIIIYIGRNISPAIAVSLFGAPSFSAINTNMYELPELNTPESKLLRSFVSFLQNEKSIPPTVEIIRDDSQQRQVFIEKLVEDKTEAGHSYYEFLQRVRQLVK